MPFIGAQPATTFAKATSQVFTNANGNIVDFTLNKHVSNPEDIEVFVANIQQQPTTSYTILSDGVTLRFSEAPPSGDFYVVYRNFAQQTGTDTGAFRKTGGTITGTLTTTGDLTVSRAETNGTVRLNLSNTGVNGSSEYSEIKLSSTAGTAATSIFQHRNNYGLNIGTTTDHPIYFLQNNAIAMAIDASGFVTKPLQPLFEVTSSTNQAISSSTLTKTTLWDTKVHDHSNNFDTSTDQFTAPVAGSYLMTCTLTLSTMVAGAGIGIVWKKQSTGGSMDIFKHPYHQSTEINITHTLTATTIMTLAANDKIELHVFQGSGYSESLTNSNVFSGSNSSSQNWQGFLIG